MKIFIPNIIRGGPYVRFCFHKRYYAGQRRPPLKTAGAHIEPFVLKCLFKTFIWICNPTISQLGIWLSNYNGNKVFISVYDLPGKTIHSQELKTSNGENYYRLNMNLPLKGEYFIAVKGDDLNELVKAMVK